MNHGRPNVLVATSRGIYGAEHSDPIGFEGDQVRALTPTGTGLLAVVRRHEIWYAPDSTDLNRWEQLGRIDHQVWSLLYENDRVIAGTEEAHLYEVNIQDAKESPPKAMESFEHGPDRTSWYTPWGGPPAVRSISVGADGALYVNVHVGGILRLAEQEAEWAQIIDISMDVHEIIAHQQSSILLAPAGRGFAESRDNGGSWRLSTDGLDFYYMRAVTVATDTLLVSSCTGPHGDRGAVYRRLLDSSDPFEKCTKGLPEWFAGNVDTFCLRAGPLPGSVAIGSPGGSVYYSGDSGETWDEIASGLPEIASVEIVA